MVCRSCEEGRTVYLRLRAYLRAGRRAGMRDSDRALRWVLLSDLGASRHEPEVARAQQVLQVPAAARIPRLGVFVPGYTRDILISPDLLFASFSPRLTSFFTLRVSSLSIPFILHSSHLSFSFPFSLSSIFNIVPTRNLSSCEAYFSNEIELPEHK